MVIPIIEELRESMRSTRVYYTTINAPRGVKILEDIIEGFDKRFGDGLSCVRATAVNLADIPRCVACVLFWVYLFVTFDCVYF